MDALLLLAAGDTIDFRATQPSAGAVSLNTIASYNYFFIKQIPTQYFLKRGVFTRTSAQAE